MSRVDASFSPAGNAGRPIRAVLDTDLRSFSHAHDTRAGFAMTPRRIWRGQLYALAAIAIWSTNYIIGRSLRDAVTPATISAFRALVAGVPLTAWVIATGAWTSRSGGRQSTRGGRPGGTGIGRILGTLIVLGFLGIFASQYLTYLALHWSLATNAIILNSASPLVSAALAVALGFAPFSRGLWTGLGISVVGGALVTVAGTSGGARLEWDPGAALIIVSMFTWGFYNLGVQRLSHDLPPLAIAAGAMLAGVPFLLAAMALERPAHLLATVRAHLPVLLYLAVGPSAVAYASWNAALRDIGAEYAMLFNNVLPIMGMLLGGLVLHEPITIIQVLASALIIGGIVIAFRSFLLERPMPDPTAISDASGADAPRAGASRVGAAGCGDASGH
jgi:drug/metabolite transporter (DMT)-like permease